MNNRTQQTIYTNKNNDKFVSHYELPYNTTFIHWNIRTNYKNLNLFNDCSKRLISPITKRQNIANLNDIRIALINFGLHLLQLFPANYRASTILMIGNNYEKWINQTYSIVNKYNIKWLIFIATNPICQINYRQIFIILFQINYYH